MKITKYDEPNSSGSRKKETHLSADGPPPFQRKEKESKWLTLDSLVRENWPIDGFTTFVDKNRHFPMEDFKKISKLTDRVYMLLHIYGYRKPIMNFNALRAVQAIEQYPDKKVINILDTIKYFQQKSKFLLSLLNYTSDNGEGSWVSIFKWKACSFFSFYHQQDIPPFPGISDDPFLRSASKLVHGKRFQNFWNKKWKCDDSTGQKALAWSLLNSILYIKKGSPTINESCIAAQVKKSVLALTSEPVQAEETDIEIFGSCVFKPLGHEWEERSGMEAPLHGKTKLEKVVWSHPIDKFSAINEIKRTTREFFAGNTPLMYRDIAKAIFLSIKANYNSTQEELGQLGFFQREGFLDRNNYRDILRDEPLLTYDICRSMNVRKATVPFKGGNRMYQNLELEQEFNLASSYQDYSGCSTEQYSTTIGADIDFTKMELCYERLYWNVWPKAIEEIPYVKPVGLGEPFKVRVISKGPPLKYFCLKPIQEYLWRSLKNNTVCSLIGEMVNANHINDIFNQWNPDGRKIIVSGDYKASTDNLHSWVSQAINDQLCEIFEKRFPKEELELLPENFFRDLHQMIEDCLTNHIFDNRKKVKDNVLGDVYVPEIPGLGLLLPQKEGQLMGSIISFPFLCIANAALCRWAMEIADGKQYRLQDVASYNSHVPLAPLRINGDDCVFSGDEFNIRHCWETIGNFLGLSSSIGKTYFSKEFCVINSVLYDFKRYDSMFLGKTGYFVERPYINLGLLFGQAKTNFGNSDKQVWHLGALHRDLLGSCPSQPEIRERVHNQFMINVKPILQKMEEVLGDYKMQYFWPEWLGGLGLDPSYHKYSFFDRATMHAQRKLISLDASLRPLKGGDFIEWKMHQLIESNYYRKLNWLGVVPFNEIQNDEDQWKVLEKESQNIYGKLTLSLLFDPCINLDDLHKRTVVHVEANEGDSKQLIEKKRKKALLKKTFYHNVKVQRLNARQIELCREFVLSDRSEKVQILPLDDVVHDSSKLYLPLCEKTFRKPTMSWGRTHITTVKEMLNNY